MSAKNIPGDKITEDDVVCEACRNIAVTEHINLLNEASGSGGAVTRQRGHSSVCCLCGCSTLQRQSHLIIRNNPTELQQAIRNIIEGRVAPRQINLRLILVSGKTKEFTFSPVDSAGDIAMHVYDNWAEADWASECVSRAEILRLIYQGRFLHSSVTLGALGLPLGRTTVMHLVPREHLPEPNSHDQRQKSKGGSSSCCSASCCIL